MHFLLLDLPCFNFRFTTLSLLLSSFSLEMLSLATFKLGKLKLSIPWRQSNTLPTTSVTKVKNENHKNSPNDPPTVPIKSSVLKMYFSSMSWRSVVICLMRRCNSYG